MSEAAIEVDSLRKSFGDDSVLDGIDLSVRENEILVLMGPNGVGKTLFLSCLAGSKEPTAGQIEVFGNPTPDRSEYLAFMLQETMAMDTLTGRQNIRFYSGLNPAFTDRWEGYLAELGLHEDLDKNVEHYSGGMKRKLELAMTMSIDVPIYLLDEPTAGVDMSMIQQFHNIILDRFDDGGTFVITSHSPMDADLADRIAFIPDGTISATGTPEELMADVPTVVSLSGTESIATAEEYVLDEQLFPIGGEARGFVADEATVEELRGALDDSSLETVAPTYADMFNYYVHIDDD